MRRLVVDTSNLLFSVAAVNSYNRAADPKDTAGLAMHMTLNVLAKYARELKPQQIALAFEGRANWRKDYTKSEACISKQVYKANRVKDPSMQLFFDLIKNFEEMAREHTSLVCLSHASLEGDDSIAAYCQRFNTPEDELYVVSGDDDFLQLYRQPNVKFVGKLDKNVGIDKKSKKPLDPDYFIFEKCFRGDSGDNVMSAYPRLRKTKIEEAYKDEYARQALFSHEWEAELEPGVKTVFNVGELWQENKLLMDLTCQPEEIRNIMPEMVDNAIEARSKFSLFHFQKFLGKYELKKISENVSSYVEILSMQNQKSSSAANLLNEQTSSQPETPTKKSILQF